jgi:hypothetical protein
MPIRQPVKSLFDVERDEREERLDTVEDKRKESKAFVVNRMPNGLYVISFTAGGEVPSVLKGSFTSGVKAQEAAATYLTNRNAAPAN